MKDRSYVHTCHEGLAHGDYKKGCGKGKYQGKTGKDHRKVLDCQQDQPPDEQRLRQAMDNRNRLKTVARDPATKVHGLSKVNHSAGGHCSAH